jgi:hypothetical protein
MYSMRGFLDSWLFLLVMLVWLALLSACAQANPPTAFPLDNVTPSPIPTMTAPSPTVTFTVTPTPLITPAEEIPAVKTARQALAKRLNVDAQKLNLREVSDQQWSDSCLGLAQPGEMCAQVIVPGYLVVFELDGRTYPVRTDARGLTVRIP